MKRLFYLFTFLLMAWVTVSCHDDVLTNSSAQPSVEVGAEGYDFGSLLIGSTSATQHLIIYNQNKGVLELQSIALRKGAESPFKVNVDGMAGTVFDRPELLHIDRGDSLYVLMEVTAPSRQEEREQLLEDYLDILCNGQKTSIRLKALSMSVQPLRDYTLSENERWDASGTDKQIFGKLTIPEGVTLTVTDSTRLYLHDQATIEVYGTLVLQGASADHRVMLLGDRQDKMFDNLFYRDMVGQWGGINFYPSSQHCLIEQADIKGMTTGIQVEDTELTLRNSIVKNSNETLIYAKSGHVILENSCLMNSGGALVELEDGNHEIVHCTLANYQFWTSFPEHDLLLRNCHCLVQNSIIYGQAEKTVSVGLEYDETYPDGEAPYRFDHCLIKAQGEDDGDFISILWNEDPLYLLVDMPNYVCDPHLQETSPARGKGNAEALQRVSLDLDGKPRGEHPTIGCYE